MLFKVAAFETQIHQKKNTRNDIGGGIVIWYTKSAWVRFFLLHLTHRFKSNPFHKQTETADVRLFHSLTFFSSFDHSPQAETHRKYAESTIEFDELSRYSIQSNYKTAIPCDGKFKINDNLMWAVDTMLKSEPQANANETANFPFSRQTNVTFSF